MTRFARTGLAVRAGAVLDGLLSVVVRDADDRVVGLRAAVGEPIAVAARPTAGTEPDADKLSGDVGAVGGAAMGADADVRVALAQFAACRSMPATRARLRRRRSAMSMTTASLSLMWSLMWSSCWESVGCSRFVREWGGSAATRPTPPLATCACP